MATRRLKFREVKVLLFQIFFNSAIRYWPIIMSHPKYKVVTEIKASMNYAVVLLLHLGTGWRYQLYRHPRFSTPTKLQV